jgi:hypothetical protein
MAICIIYERQQNISFSLVSWSSNFLHFKLKFPTHSYFRFYAFERSLSSSHSKSTPPVHIIQSVAYILQDVEHRSFIN